MTVSTSLVYAAGDRKHRPASHPVFRGQPITAEVAEALMGEARFYETIATNLRKARLERGWSQRRVGAIVRRTAVTVCKWETLQVRPDAWCIERLERVFGQRLRP